jgi:hypothetical protein
LSDVAQPLVPRVLIGVTKTAGFVLVIWTVRENVAPVASFTSPLPLF